MTMLVITIAVLLLAWGLWMRRAMGPVFSPVATGLAGVVLAFGFWHAERLFPRLPQLIAVHFNAAGHPTGWVEKTPASVLLLSACALTLTLLLDLIAWALVVASRRSVQPAASFRNMQSSARFLQWMAVILALDLVGLQELVLPPQTQGALPSAGLLFLPVLLTIFAALGGVLWLGWIQMGNPETTPAPIRTDGPSQNRKPGSIFYYDPDNPALLVQRPGGAGWTLNFARPAAWGLVVLLFLLPLLPIWLNRR